jgi:hypothetical protein
MNVYLPDPLFLIIYSYVGHNSLYLNKYYYKFLIDRRKEFVDKPLKISYRLCKWKQKQYDIENNYSRKMRPSMKVDIESIIDISGGRVFGEIDKNGILQQFTKKFEGSILPVSECKQTTYPFYCMVVYYWTIYSLKCDEIKRYKRYQNLWVS